MELNKALKIAEKTKAELAPHCERIEIIGSIRCKEPEINKIEMIAILKPYILIPEPYNVGLFEIGIQAVVNQWRWWKVKGELPCSHMQRVLPGGMKLDLYFVEADNWDRVFAMRTSVAYYSHQRQAARRKSASLKLNRTTSLKIEEK